MSRPESRIQTNTKHSSNGTSPTDNVAQVEVELSEPPTASTSPRRLSEASEGYPSWLPKRPPPPGPTSTIRSSLDRHGPLPAERFPFVGGRRPTPRHMRVVSIQDASQAEKDGRREATDQTRVSNFPGHRRVWSRATSAGLTTTVFSSEPLLPQVPRPGFHAKGLQLEVLRNPSKKSRILFYLLPLFVFGHIPLQTFLDFNAVFMLLQVAKYPNRVPGSGKNWALGAAAYTACWLAWILLVFIAYELIYSFWRRWRVRRPLIIPLYLSSPAFHLVSMTSYVNFCFMRHIRWMAFFGENGSLRDGLAETFWFYAQNLPTVILLLPRAGLCISLLLAFSRPEPGVVALLNDGVVQRDSTFFRKTDGTLTTYARAILIANAAWTGWRVLVLIVSLVGLWVISGEGFAGLCGPRYRWEEEENEKTVSMFSDTGSQDDALPWRWKVATRLRIQEAYDFCVSNRHSTWAGKRKEVSDFMDPGPTLPEVHSAPTFEGGVDQILAAIGFPSGPTPARRGILSGELFATPAATEEQGPSSRRVARRSSPVAGPSKQYPFTARGAQISSDKIPFPPSPESSSGRRSAERESAAVGDEEDDDDEDDEDDEDEDEQAPVQEIEVQSEEPSSGRGSNSMSSLGHPVTSPYPFQFHHPHRASLASNTPSRGAQEHESPSTMSRSTNSNSRVSRSTMSTGNRDSTDSQSPRSNNDSSPGGAGIPMPPRRVRTRPGTAPSPVYPVSPSHMVFPRSAAPRARTESSEPAVQHPAIGDEEIEDYGDDYVLEQPEPEGSHEADEGEDYVGLLTRSAGPSPRTSFLNLRARARSLRSASGSNSRSDSHTGSSSSRSRAVSFSRAMPPRTRSASISNVVRSRAQSLIRAASRSSSDLARSAGRSRANSSMARLEEDTPYSSEGHARRGSRSRSRPSSAEDNGVLGQPMFGHPLRMQLQMEADEEGRRRSRGHTQSTVMMAEPSSRIQSASRVSISAPSDRHSEHTATEQQLQGIPIPGRGSDQPDAGDPDTGSVPQSFVTAPATTEGMTEESASVPRVDQGLGDTPQT